MAIVALYLLKIFGFFDKIKTIEQFRDYIESFGAYAVILFINNEDFEQLVELDDFTTDYFFIINEAVPSGRPFYIVDEDLKKYIYVNIIKEKCDNVFRGRKQR